MSKNMTITIKTGSVQEPVVAELVFSTPNDGLNMLDLQDIIVNGRTITATKEAELSILKTIAPLEDAIANAVETEILS